jgi:hypothetical protein
MAQWRREDEDQPPPELFESRADDWVGSRLERCPWCYPGIGRSVFMTPKEMWWTARIDWAKNHPHSRALGGDLIDVIFHDEEPGTKLSW